MTTVITPSHPAQKTSRVVDSVGQFWMEITPSGGSILGGAQHLIQQLHAGLTAPDANPTDHQRAAYLETLDARMRKSWDEKQRRDDPSRKTFTFRMDKQITSKLAALRKRWVMPSASIVESLIQDAVIKNKRQEDVEKAPEEALKRQKRTNLQLVKLRSQRDRAQKEAAQLRKMLRKLIKRLTETEYRRSNKLSLTELLDPSHVIAIKKMTDEAELAYLEGKRPAITPCQTAPCFQ